MQARLDAATRMLELEVNERCFLGRVLTPRERVAMRLSHFRAKSGYAAWMDKGK